jgi:hypothetical protein
MGMLPQLISNVAEPSHGKEEKHVISFIFMALTSIP